MRQICHWRVPGTSDSGGTARRVMQRIRAGGAWRNLVRPMAGAVPFGEADDDGTAVRIDWRSSYTSLWRTTCNSAESGATRPRGLRLGAVTQSSWIAMVTRRIRWHGSVPGNSCNCQAMRYERLEVFGGSCGAAEPTHVSDEGHGKEGESCLVQGCL